MTIVLNHTIVPARDKEESARFFARIFGLKYEGPMSHFAQVRVNDGLTFDFDTDTNFESHHYAFMVSDAEFDAIFGRIQGESLAYGSGPMNPRQHEGQRGAWRQAHLFPRPGRAPAGDHDALTA